jgi:hypothetical protein
MICAEGGCSVGAGGAKVGTLPGVLSSCPNAECEISRHRKNEKIEMDFIVFNRSKLNEIYITEFMTGGFKSLAGMILGVAKTPQKTAFPEDQGT